MHARVPIVLLLLLPAIVQSAELPASGPRFELHPEPSQGGNAHAPRFSASLTAPVSTPAKVLKGPSARFHLYAPAALNAAEKGLTACDPPIGIFADGFESP